MRPAPAPSDRDRSPTDWRLLAAAGTRREMTVGSALTVADEGPCSLLLVLTGAVKVVGLGQNGGSATLAVRRAGSIIGDFDMTGPARRAIDVVALIPSTAVVVPAQRLAAAVRARPGLALALLGIVGARTAESDSRLIEHVTHDVPARIRRRLLELSTIFNDGAIPTVVPLTQQDLAELAGVSREATAKVLRRLREIDAVRTARSRLVVVRPDLIAEGT